MNLKNLDKDQENISSSSSKWEISPKFLELKNSEISDPESGPLKTFSQSQFRFGFLVVLVFIYYLKSWRTPKRNQSIATLYLFCMYFIVLKYSTNELVFAYYFQ